MTEMMIEFYTLHIKYVPTTLNQMFKGSNQVFEVSVSS